ncbi:hypothetical protein, partial [Luteimonas composti]|uniref:hypothetical protein n=1 Tax=Luteimonas composti TaxID=398257 RepID=UPI0036D8BA07
MSVLRVDGLYCFTWYGSVGASHSRIELPIRWRLSERNKKPPAFWGWGFGVKTLAMTYSRMRLHTTIGAFAFHFRVR